ncbi:hypothetical protein [Pseudomonas aeruginosa]|uniref:hypothetical protein n=1 Tax=Pseudomonas aeruginosa TaxID=287 RepID=UPI0039849E05|nr:hypothetical protein [Pseudomonas aeruginosa]
MKSDINLTSLHLREWAEFLLHVSAVGEFRDKVGRHEFSFGLPGGEELNVAADTPDQLAKKVMAELADTLVSPPAVPEHSRKGNCSAAAIQGGPEETMTKHSDDQASTQTSKTYTKAKKVTVGVSSNRAMYDMVASAAEKRGLSAAEMARQLVEQSLDRFYTQVDEESPRQLFERYEEKLLSYGEKSYQWMARLDADLGLDIKLAAQEFKKSTSQMVGYLVAEGLAQQVECQSADVADEEMRAALDATEPFIGVRAKTLAESVGLGKQRVLMNQVLGGAVLAPRRLLDALSRKLGVTADSLRKAFEFRFFDSTAPAFKAPDGSPTVCLQAKTWEVGVKALQLPSDEEQKLLALGD